VPNPTLDEAKRLSRKGVFFVCASCAKMQEGLALGKDGCTGVDCGSPVRRKDFPQYEGSLKDLSSICFACGSEDILAYASVEGGERRFGICKDHLEVIDRYIAPGDGLAASFKKVLIFPRVDKALGEFANAVHAI